MRQAPPGVVVDPPGVVERFGLMSRGWARSVEAVVSISSSSAEATWVRVPREAASATTAGRARSATSPVRRPSAVTARVCEVTTAHTQSQVVKIKFAVRGEGRRDPLSPTQPAQQWKTPADSRRQGSIPG